MLERRRLTDCAYVAAPSWNDDKRNSTIDAGRRHLQARVSQHSPAPLLLVTLLLRRIGQQPSKYEHENYIEPDGNGAGQVGKTTDDKQERGTRWHGYDGIPNRGSPKRTGCVGVMTYKVGHRFLPIQRARRTITLATQAISEPPTTKS